MVCSCLVPQFITKKYFTHLIRTWDKEKDDYCVRIPARTNSDFISQFSITKLLRNLWRNRSGKQFGSIWLNQIQKEVTFAIEIFDEALFKLQAYSFEAYISVDMMYSIQSTKESVEECENNNALSARE